jgi:sulfonate transport system substrate-binding protein
MKRRTFSAAVGALAFASRPSFAQDKPPVIRIGFPGAGTGGRPLIGGSYIANSHHLRAIDEEFKADGIRIEWKFFPGADPALNESLANGLVDFGFGHGDLPVLVGRSTGLKQKVIASSGRGGDSYFVAPAASSAKTLAELKGKRIATFKGAAAQLTLNRWFEKFGLSDKDFRVISLDGDSTLAALSTGDIDGTVRAPFDLEARGVARCCATWCCAQRCRPSSPASTSACCTRGSPRWAPNTCSRRARASATCSPMAASTSG